jgi:hypothetical protein
MKAGGAGGGEGRGGDKGEPSYRFLGSLAKKGESTRSRLSEMIVSNDNDNGTGIIRRCHPQIRDFESEMCK